MEVVARFFFVTKSWLVSRAFHNTHAQAREGIRAQNIGIAFAKLMTEFRQNLPLMN